MVKTGAAEFANVCPRTYLHQLPTGRSAVQFFSPLLRPVAYLQHARHRGPNPPQCTVAGARRDVQIPDSDIHHGSRAVHAAQLPLLLCPARLLALRLHRRLRAGAPGHPGQQLHRDATSQLHLDPRQPVPRHHRRIGHGSGVPADRQLAGLGDVRHNHRLDAVHLHPDNISTDPVAGPTTSRWHQPLRRARYRSISSQSVAWTGCSVYCQYI